MTDAARADFVEVRRLFDLVCDLAPDERRGRYAEEGADAATIAEVESLLDCEGSDTVLRAPVLRMLGALPETELGEGDRLGAWRLLRRLGSGGMGAVHLAERADGHFEQQAAIKLIRGMPGSDTLAHFARERQILATLQHPHIARLLDGGATPGGQPYLVMEYVEGVPIDEYCRDRGLDLRARLALFRAVCDAVQFAHQRLIVHCDLKPSNVLVRRDGTPVLLDFGIARALDRPRAAEADGYFTPGYASPEQLAGETLTTASDVYALGLVLFELVTGRKARVDTADRTVARLAEASVRPSDLAGDVPWRARLAGDLDAIVLHATAARAAARYASAQELGDDVQRFLEHRPVKARAQTVRYRAARLLRRRWPVALAAGCALLVLGAFTWRLALENARARSAEQEARRQAATAERVSEFLVSVFDTSNPRLNAGHRDISAREVLDEGAARIERELDDAPQVKAHLLDVLATAYRHLGEPKPSIALFRAATDLYLDPRVNEPLKAAEALSQLAVVYANNAYPATDVEAAARRALELRTRYAPDDARALADSWNTLGLAFEAQDRYEEAEAALHKGLDLRRTLAIDVPGDGVASSLHNLGLVAAKRADYAHALGYYREALALKREQFGEHHPDYQISLQGYARALSDSGQPAQAVPLFERNIALCHELYGERSAKSADAHNVLGYTLQDLGRFADAAAQYREALRIHAGVSGKDTAAYAVPLNNLATAYEDMGDYAAAIPLYEESLQKRRATLPDGNRLVLRAEYNLARALVRAGRLREAKAPLERALDGMRAHFGEDDVNTAKCELTLGEWQLASGMRDQAAKTLQSLLRSRATLTPLVRARREAFEADIALAAHDPPTALEHRRAALDAVRARYGEAHPYVAEFALAYAAALSDAGRDAEARALAGPLRGMIATTFAESSPVRAALARWH
ncbi:MAG TPA: serine/threonine-protein kinase [Dokdonella sp.]|nr:serine/threonine-protein kinase [Dokdonella sp.]